MAAFIVVPRARAIVLLALSVLLIVAVSIGSNYYNSMGTLLRGTGRAVRYNQRQQVRLPGGCRQLSRCLHTMPLRSPIVSELVISLSRKLVRPMGG